jgi:HSP20 family protein
MAGRQEISPKGNSKMTTAPIHEVPELVFKPAVDIVESDRDIILLVDMPGVAADSVTVNLRDDRLTISGSVPPWEGAEESDSLVEFEIGRYFRQFVLPNAVDRDKIDARCTDGTLRLGLAQSRQSLAVPDRSEDWQIMALWGTVLSKRADLTRCVGCLHANEKTSRLARIPPPLHLHSEKKV